MSGVSTHVPARGNPTAQTKRAQLDELEKLNSSTLPTYSTGQYQPLLCCPNRRKELQRSPRCQEHERAPGHGNVSWTFPRRRTQIEQDLVQSCTVLHNIAISRLRGHVWATRMILGSFRIPQGETKDGKPVGEKKRQRGNNQRAT